MSQLKTEIPAYIGFGVYTVLGAILRYFITFPCGSEFESIHISIGQAAIIFIIIGIGWGLHSFVRPNKMRPRVGHGVVTGLGAGFGGMTVYALLNPCV